MQAIIYPDFSNWLLDIGNGMIPLPLTPKTQFSVEVPISLISNDIVSDVLIIILGVQILKTFQEVQFSVQETKVGD